MVGKYGTQQLEGHGLGGPKVVYSIVTQQHRNIHAQMQCQGMGPNGQVSWIILLKNQTRTSSNLKRSQNLYIGDAKSNFLTRSFF